MSTEERLAELEASYNNLANQFKRFVYYIALMFMLFGGYLMWTLIERM